MNRSNPSTTFLLTLFHCLALIHLTCTCSYAIGKTTVNPNAGGASPSKALVAPDARLAQKVTYDARCVPVQQILEDLTAMTGIKLYAGTSKSDWQVRSRKMNVFVKDVTMAGLMSSIAHTMKFKWSFDKDLTPPSYRLVVDSKAAAAADAQLNSACKQSEQQWQKRRQDWVDAIMKYGGMSTPQLEVVCENDPILLEFARRGAIQALHALFVEVPETKSRYAAGQSFRVSSEALSQDVKGLLFDSGNELWKYLQKKWREAPVGYNGLVKPDESFDIACYRLDTGCFTPNLKWATGSVGNTAYFHIAKGESDFEIANLSCRDSEWESFRSKAHIAIMDGADPKQVWADLQGIPMTRLTESQEKEEELLYPSEPLNEHPAFDELEKTIKLKIENPKADQNPALAVNSYIASFQKALADATGLGVVSDSWVNIDGEKLPDQEAKLGELLDKFSTNFNYNWDESSDILEFRHRKWWKNRLNQISDDVVATWSNNTRKNGVLSLDDLAQISNLTYDQAEESLKADKVLGTGGIYKQMLSILDTNCNIYWLWLYSTLSSQQRASLTDRWLSGAMLSIDQWKLAQNMFDRIGSLRSDALFSLKVVPNANELIYEFREFEVSTQRTDGTDEEGKEDRKWVVALPKYTPPPVHVDANKQPI